ncbi:hypothetical protein [Cellulosilyticum sp. WCF-2]|uniref:hypothetical protein n=1 Tax=Cellulosilyticum sp. WCF-2 TaxID=2497860 RepID=UPI000F8D2634|nr:hypothetical protein [Cellulosilyticum sp. WCF-2]QEH69934.1 hypothetical protein EKH84_16645 [Cellulosilyticum sp. WCF-2]
MTEYAIKIDDKYFYDFVYATKGNSGIYAGHGAQGSLIKEGDIIDLELTEIAKRTFSRRSIGTKISLILQVDQYKRKDIHIVPMI